MPRIIFIKLWPLWLFCLGTLGSCEKVIQVSIADTDKKYVIEGMISDQMNSCRVNLSQTLNINDSNKFRGISGAEISIRENEGVDRKLIDIGGGIYRLNFSGRPGNRYTLTVKIKGQVFSAASTMPGKVNLDTLYITERSFLGKIRKFATVEFRDPPGKGNAYRFIQFVNGMKEMSIFISKDELFDGKKVTYDLLSFGDETPTFEKDDQLRVEFRCIDQANYLYLYSLEQGAFGQGQSATPDNPVSNIRGGALGYFSAHTTIAKVIVIQ
jgi:hypothetical protein